MTDFLRKLLETLGKTCLYFSSVCIQFPNDLESFGVMICKLLKTFGEILMKKINQSDFLTEKKSNTRLYIHKKP